MAWEELWAGVGIPTLIIMFFAWIKEQMDIEGDNPTDLLVTLLIFDVSVLFGFAPHLEEALGGAQRGFHSVMVAGALTFTLAIISLWLHKFYDACDTTPPLDRTTRLKLAGLRAMCNMPAVAAIADHVLRFGLAA
jgi:hypothetical protein